MITFLCSKCGLQHSVPDEWAGKSAKCPCGMKLSVPLTIKLEPDQPEIDDEPNEPEENENDFFDPNDLGSIPSTAHRYAARRKPWWVSAIKFTSAAAVVAALLVFGYPHYSPQLEKLLAAWQDDKTSSEASKDLAQNINDARQKETAEKSKPETTEKLPPKVATDEVSPPENAQTQVAAQGEPGVMETLEEMKDRQERPLSIEVPEVTLPSGRSVSALLLSPPEATEIAILKIPDTDHYYLTSTDGRILAVCQYDPKTRKIEGLVMRTHSNGTMSSLAKFSRSKHNGPTYCWNKDGQLCYYCEWINGNKQGLACLFENEKPALIQEWKTNQLLTQYRVQYRNNEDLKPNLEPVGGFDNTGIAQFEKQITSFENKIDRADTNLRRCFARDLKKIKPNVRIAADRNSPEQLAQIADLENEQKLQEQAAKTEFWRKATTGTQWSGKQRWLAPKTEPAGKH